MEDSADGQSGHLTIPSPLHLELYMTGGTVAWSRERTASLQQLSDF